MRRVIAYLVLSLVGIVVPAAGRPQSGSKAALSAKVTLSLAGGKTDYRIGEPILLRLTFIAVAATELNTTTTDPASPVDQPIVSPMHEVFAWLADRDGGHPYAPDYSALAQLEPGKSYTIELPLNAVYRFDGAGHYSVHVVTHRVQALGPLTTNAVGFDVQPMTDADEASQAAALEAKIRHAHNLEIAQGYARELDWLTGDPSTRVKLSLFLNPKIFYPFGVDVKEGLWIARNRTLVVKQLEEALNDVNQELSSAGGLLETAVALRAKLDSRDAQEVESGYLKPIAASLPQRSGEALITAAQTVFVRLAQRHEVSGPEFAAAREVVITHFADVNEYNVDWMLNAYGNYLQDPRILPALKQILARRSDHILDGERTAVIKQLMKIAPQESRAEVVKEVCGDNPSITQILRDMPYPTLPETDACLQEKLAAAIQGNKHLPIQWAAELTARFVSAAPYDLLFTLYRQSAADWNKQAQGYLLAYLVRWNAKKAWPLLEAALPATPSQSDFDLTYTLGRMGYIADIDAFWRERLTSSSAEMAAQAAFQMSENGPNEDQSILQRRLNEWRTQWKGREIPHAEAKLEGELTQAAMSGANWKLSKDEMQALASGCLSKMCRERFAGLAAH
jgi:hypothetical protein